MIAGSSVASTETIVAGSQEEQAAMAAELLARAIHEAVETRGVARVALSGGTTPSDTYRHLASLALPFRQVEWYWVDERAGDPDGARSNYAAAARDLKLDDGAHGKAFRLESEAADLTAAA